MLSTKQFTIVGFEEGNGSRSTMRMNNFPLVERFFMDSLVEVVLAICSIKSLWVECQRAVCSSSSSSNLNIAVVIVCICMHAAHLYPRRLRSAVCAIGEPTKICFVCWLISPSVWVYVTIIKHELQPFSSIDCVAVGTIQIHSRQCIDSWSKQTLVRSPR